MTAEASQEMQMKENEFEEVASDHQCPDMSNIPEDHGRPQNDTHITHKKPRAMTKVTIHGLGVHLNTCENRPNLFMNQDPDRGKEVKVAEDQCTRDAHEEATKAGKKHGAMRAEQVTTATKAGGKHEATRAEQATTAMGIPFQYNMDHQISSRYNNLCKDFYHHPYRDIPSTIQASKPK